MQIQCKVRFIFCRTAPHLVAFFQRVGLVPYGPEWVDPVAGRQICLVGLPQDSTYISAVGSAICPDFVAASDCNNDRSWLVHLS